MLVFFTSDEQSITNYLLSHHERNMHIDPGPQLQAGCPVQQLPFPILGWKMVVNGSTGKVRRRAREIIQLIEAISRDRGVSGKIDVQGAIQFSRLRSNLAKIIPCR